MNILIVDDEPRSRKGLCRMLEERISGLVWTASSGKEALALVESQLPHGLLVDINMPGMDGLEMISRLREKHPHLPVLIVTGYNDFSYAKRAVDLGVLGFLLKPIAPEELDDGLDRIARFISAAKRSEPIEEWSRRELSDNLQIHRRQFFSDLLSGQIHGRDLIMHLKALELDSFYSGWLLLSRYQPPLPQDLRQGFSGNYSDGSCILETLVEGFTVALMVGPSMDDLSRDDALSAWEATRGNEYRRQESHLLTVSLGWEGLNVYREQLMGEFGTPRSPLIRAAENLVEKHYGDGSFSLRMASDLLQISSSHLSREFKKSMGRSFTEYLTDHRIRAAAEDLERADPAVKIYEIAEQNGFKNQYYFSRVFRDVTGLSPKEYRS